MYILENSLCTYSRKGMIVMHPLPQLFAVAVLECGLKTAHWAVILVDSHSKVTRIPGIS